MGLKSSEPSAAVHVTSVFSSLAIDRIAFAGRATYLQWFPALSINERPFLRDASSTVL